MQWYAQKPANPVTGDCYFDTFQQLGLFFDGTGWITIYSGPTLRAEPPIPEPTEEQLEKYPSLKEAWEYYKSIRKLCGV